MIDAGERSEPRRGARVAELTKAAGNSRRALHTYGGANSARERCGLEAAPDLPAIVSMRRSISPSAARSTT
jgi:hypothetical protein